MLYWCYNLIAQNITQPGFPRVLYYLKDSFKYFLYKQWHERLTDNQIDELYDSIVKYFNLYEMIKEESEKRANEAKPRTPPIFRIRGLVMRDNEDNDVSVN